MLKLESKTKQYINTVSKPPSRKCSGCGNPYYRVNTSQQWTGRNPGKRLGWHKDIVRFCTKCLSPEESKRIIAIADVQFTQKQVIRKK